MGLHDFAASDGWLDQFKTSEAGSQYCWGQVGWGIQPPASPHSHPTPTHTHAITFALSEMRYFRFFNSSMTDRWTDGQTEQWMDGHPHPSYGPFMKLEVDKCVNAHFKWYVLREWDWGLWAPAHLSALVVRVFKMVFIWLQCKRLFFFCFNQIVTTEDSKEDCTG